MDKKLFTSSEVKLVLDLSQRRLTSLSEKVVVSVVGARGAGFKRLYDLTNIHELALAEHFFGMGFSLHLVKQVVADSRSAGQLRAWVEKPEAFLNKEAEKHISYIEENKDKIKSDSKKWTPMDSSILDSPGFLGDREEFIQRMQDQKYGGIFVYIFGVEANTAVVLPWDMKTFLGAPILREYLLQGDGAIFVSLGRLKQKIEEGLSKVK